MNRGLCLSNLVVTGQAGLIVTRMDLRIEPGQTVALVGESGSGKSTLVKLLVGLYATPTGKIYYNGIESTSIDRDELQQQLAGQQFELRKLATRMQQEQEAPPLSP